MRLVSQSEVRGRRFAAPIEDVGIVRQHQVREECVAARMPQNVVAQLLEHVGYAQRTEQRPLPPPRRAAAQPARSSAARMPSLVDLVHDAQDVATA